jgi:hypothetical protein
LSPEQREERASSSASCVIMAANTLPNYSCE